MKETLEITDIRIKKYGNPKSNVLGVVSITLEGQLVIHGIKIVQLKNRRILSFPAKRISKTESGEEGIKHYYTFEDVVHPLNAEFRTYLENLIFTQFDRAEVTSYEQNY